MELPGQLGKELKGRRRVFGDGNHRGLRGRVGSPVPQKIALLYDIEQGLTMPFVVPFYLWSDGLGHKFCVGALVSSRCVMRILDRRLLKRLLWPG